MPRRERPPPAATNHYYTREPRRQDTVTPPWERAATKRVPFIDGNTASRKYYSQSLNARSSPDEPPGKYWTSAASQRQAAPYETPLGFPPTRSNTAPVSRPDYHYVPRVPIRILGSGPAPPLTPPDSTRSKSIDHTNVYYPRDPPPPPPPPQIRVLPGTMSTRPTTTTTTTIQHASHQQQQQQQQQNQQETSSSSRSSYDALPELPREPEKLRKRLKAALSNIFKKRVTNEEDYITVGEKHWTDE
ncbi:hypothetical protein BST61_g7803 [Cercospora zeina]